MSGGQPLVFGRIEIRRSPGIQTPYALDGLCHGINIIHGPNASGKTTSAQAIHALLWPDTPCWPRGALSGRLNFDGSEWYLDFDAGRFRCQRDGVDGSRIGVGGPETRDRYILTLHELLQVDNESFAATIMRESVGGYDVDAAVRELRYRDSASRPTLLLNRLDEAKSALEEARQAQQGLVSQQDGLADLRVRRDDARNAHNRAELLARAIRFKKAELALEDARRRVDSFPPTLERLRGDETETLSALQKRLSELRDRQTRELTTIASAKVDIAASKLEGRPVRAGLISALRAQCQELQGLADEVEREKRSWRAAGEQRESARARIGDEFSESQLHDLDVTGLRELAQLVKQIETVRANEDAQAALHDWVGDILPPSNLDQLREGISYLNRWLKTPEAGSAQADARLVTVARIAAILVIVISLLAALLAYWFFAVAALAGVGLLLLARPASDALQAERLTVIQNDYARLGLEPVDAWSSESVAKVLDRLNDALRKGIVDEEKAHRWGDLAAKRETATAARQDVEQQRDQLTERYGLVPATSADLFLMTQNLDRWQVADVEARKARLNYDRTESARNKLLDEINHELGQFGYQLASDHAAVLGNIEDLDSRVRSFTEANRILIEQQRLLDEDVVPSITQIREQIRSLFVELDLEEDDVRALQELVAQRDGFNDAIARQKESEFELRSAASSLGDNDDLKQRDLNDLEAERNQALEIASRYDTLNDQVVAIETRVDDAKEKHDIERAMSAEADALDMLRSEREGQYHLVAGWSLGEFVRQQTRDRDRPRVFHRAREMFSRITYGRYRLDLADNPGPEFRATDTTTGVGFGLHELSSATRVQLLMAVRMAFVEEMEQGPKLPLILDEVLGNSDEARARAIIDATIEICRGGRQVFYFTAQHDEVGKWIQILNEHQDVTYRELDLAEARGLADIERLPTLEIVAAQTPEIPSPEGKTRLEYRELIGVPGIDPWADIGSVHLWYLVHDSQALYHLLRNHVHSWGQLKTLVDYGGATLLQRYPGTVERAGARVEVVRATMEAWRVGRGKRIDRAVLLESNAISDRFIDEVSQLTDVLNGDATALVTALDDGQVKGFRRAAVDDFRTYCLGHGYLSDAEPLTVDDIRVRVVASASSSITTGLINSDDVDEIISYWRVAGS